MTPAAKLDGVEVEEALNREVLSCVRDETVRAFRRQPSVLARRVVAS